LARKNAVRPTGAELEILGVLWDRGSSTVRDVHERLARGRDLGYTTVLKLLQIMAEKGLVRRDESQRAHVYSARVPAEQTQRQLIGDLLDRAFGGSAALLVQQALSSQKTSAEEIERIREHLNALERNRK
jgi:predicted transcriptional regulator